MGFNIYNNIIRKGKVKLLFFVFLILIILFSCNKVGLEDIKEKKKLRIGILSFPKTLNPIYTTDEVSTIISNKVYDSLYYFDNNGTPKSRIIEDEKIKNNNKKLEIVFSLRKNIFFSDGKKLKTEDIIETVELLKDKKYLSPYRPYVISIKEIKRISDFEFIIVFKKKNANWRNYLTFKILNSKEIKNISYEKLKTKLLLGSGPLKFDLVMKPSKIILSLNRFYNKYKRCFPFYSKVIYSVISYSFNSSLKLLNDEIDIVGLEPDSFSVYKRNPKWKKYFNVFEYKKFGYTYMVFNLSNTGLTLNIRRIIFNHLFNNSFLKKFLKGKGEIVKTPFLQLNNKINSNKFETFPLKKKQQFKIFSNIKSRIRKEFVLFLVNELKSYNIELIPVFLEHQLLLDKLRKNDFEIAISGLILDVDFDLKDVFYTNAYFNYSGYSSSEMDRLLNIGLEELNICMREKIYRKANKVWLKDLPLLPLFNLYYYTGVSKNIPIAKNIVSMMGSSGDFLQNIEQWIYGPFR